MQYKEKKLKGGATLIYSKKEKNPFTSIIFEFCNGSYFENSDNSGAAHFLEHVLFSGGTKYNKNEIALLPETWGGYINATTSYNKTQYELEILNEFTEKGIDLLIDMTFMPKMSEEYFEQEKKVILEEYYYLPDDIDSKYHYDNFNLINKNLFKNKIIGTLKSIENMTLEKLQDFYNENYGTNNLIISICSPVDFEDIISYIEPLLPEERMVKNNSNDIKFELNPENHTLIKKNIALTSLTYKKMFCFELDSNEEENYLKIISYILGDSFKSRLFKRLREELGVCYECGCETSYIWYNQIEFDIYVSSSDFDNLNIIENEINNILKDILTNISDEELNNAKNFCKGEYFRIKESSFKTAAYLAERKMNRHMINYTTQNSLELITKEDILEYLNRKFKKENEFTLVYMGKSFKIFNFIKKMLWIK